MSNKIVSQIQMPFSDNFTQKIESYIFVRVTRGKIIYNQMEKVKKYDQKGEQNFSYLSFTFSPDQENFGLSFAAPSRKNLS